MKDKIIQTLKQTFKNKYVSLSLAAFVVFAAGFGIAKIGDGGHHRARGGDHRGMMHNARFEDRGEGRGHGKGMRGDRGGNPEERVNKRVDRMRETLKLNDAQVQQIRQILTDEQKQRQAQFDARKQVTGADSARRGRPSDAEIAQMKAQRDAVDQKIAAVLTADQKAKYEEQKQKRGGKRGGRGGARS